jgi:outer membrane protein assembly factor BamB
MKIMKLPEPTPKVIRLLNSIALVSALFAVLLSVLIIVNYLQSKKADPLNSKTMTVLVDKLRYNPQDDQLRNEIRELDLLARKAFFTHQWQVKTGGLLLFLNVVVVLLCFQILDYFRKKMPGLPPGKVENFWEKKNLSRKWIVGSGIALLLVAFLFAFLTKNDLERKMGGEKSVAANREKTNTTVQGGEEHSSPPTPVVNDTTTHSGSTPAGSGTNLAKEEQNGGTWANFRGPGGNGIAFQKDIPVSWDGKSGKNVKWKTEVPLPGFNSPVVWSGKVFLTGANETKREVYCFDLNTGKMLWKTPVEKVSGSPAQSPKVNHETGFSAPTVATDGKRVYAIFANGDIIALDFEGNKIWSKNLGLPKNHYGHSSSLLVHGEKVLVQYDQTGNANIIALSGNKGDELWRTSRNVRVSWASPVLVNTGKRMELILAADPYVASYDPSTGKELWKLDAISGEVGPSIAYANGIIFSVNEYSKLAAIQMGDPPKQLWEDNEYLSDVPSPVATDQYLFLATSYGTVVCYDAKTGTRHWEKEFGGQTYSSPILVEGKIYLLNGKGTMHIFKADKTFALIGQPQIGEGSFCTPAFLDGMIIIRGDKNLYCIAKN